MSHDDDMLNVSEAAAFLGIPKRTLYDLRLPCYAYSARCTRWKRIDLEEYRESCRFTTTKDKTAGGLCSAVALTARVTSLRSSFLKAGAAPKLKPLTGKSARVFTLKQQA